MGKRNILAALFLCGFVLTAFVAQISLVYAQSSADAAVEARQRQLQAELDDLERQIAEQQKILSAKQNESASLARDIAILDAEIKQAQLKIKAHNIEIQQLSKDISLKSATIAELDAKLASGRESLADIMRKVNMLDSYSLVEVALSNKDLSEFFADLDSFHTLGESLRDLFVLIRETKSNTENEKAVLTDRKNKETDLKAAIEAEQTKTKKAQAKKQDLLKITKSEEKAYQEYLNNQQKRAAQIRSALFALRDTAAIPFGTALTYAQAAERVTRVRPALILAILQVESNLGENQGSCLVASLETGDGVGKNTGTIFERVMKAPRDTVPFEDITRRLGRDWKLTPVSCPIGGTAYYSGRGFGGAMGASQFIPSTWELFKERLGKLVGVSANSADPWNAEHSITATALYIADLGGAGGNYSSEIRAACKYYGSGGATCSYGNKVMAQAVSIQTNMIDPLQGL